MSIKSQTDPTPDLEKLADQRLGEGHRQMTAGGVGTAQLPGGCCGEGFATHGRREVR